MISQRADQSSREKCKKNIVCAPSPATAPPQVIRNVAHPHPSPSVPGRGPIRLYALAAWMHTSESSLRRAHANTRHRKRPLGRGRSMPFPQTDLMIESCRLTPPPREVESASSPPKQFIRVYLRGSLNQTSPPKRDPIDCDPPPGRRAGRHTVRRGRRTRSGPPPMSTSH